MQENPYYKQNWEHSQSQGHLGESKTAAHCLLVLPNLIPHGISRIRKIGGQNITVISSWISQGNYVPLKSYDQAVPWSIQLPTHRPSRSYKKSQLSPLQFSMPFAIPSSYIPTFLKKKKKKDYSQVLSNIRISSAGQFFVKTCYSGAGIKSSDQKHLRQWSFFPWLVGWLVDRLVGWVLVGYLIS